MNDLSKVTHIRQLRAENDTATLPDKSAPLLRQVEELRALLPALRAEAAALWEGKRVAKALDQGAA
jgi:hypothetical protein